MRIPKKKLLNWGKRRVIALKTLQDNFQDPDMIYAPFIFWVWDEPLLNPAKQAEMARAMLSQGFCPGYAHARDSMIGTTEQRSKRWYPWCQTFNGLPDDHWLTKPWFDAFGSVLGECEKKNAYFGYCDEYWWPSMQANGRLLKQHPELKAESLDWKTIDARGGEEVEVPGSFFAIAARIDRRLTDSVSRSPAVIRSKTLKVIGKGEPFKWKAPAGGEWRIYVFNKYFHCGFDGSPVNYIDGRLAEAFIKIALEPYARQFRGKLGRSIAGDFVDNEGDYGWGLAWSSTLDRSYRKRFKRDIRLWMPLMIDEDKEGVFAKARWEWFDAVSDLYAATMSSVTRWHEERGMYTTAHFWEEGLAPQAIAVGDHMKMLRAYTMPGQDSLLLKALSVHDFKEAQSVSEFEGARLMSEMMACAGWSGFTPAILKQVANAAIAWGASHFIMHGIFMNRRLEGNPWTPDWYTENPMFPYLRLWADFARRASYVNSHGHLCADALLVNPMDTVWALSDSAVFSREHDAMWDYPEKTPNGRRVNYINRVYSDAIKDLADARVEFLIGDRHYIRRMKLKGKELSGAGAFSFKAIILPPMDILPLDIAEKIVKFADAGGYVYALGELPAGSTERGSRDPDMERLMKKLRLLPSFRLCEKGLKKELCAGAKGLASHIEFISGAFPVLQHHMKINGCDFFWLANNTDRRQKSEIRVRNSRGCAAIWDCETGSKRPVNSRESGGCSRLTAAFRPYEAYWLVFNPRSRPFNKGPEQKPQARTVMALKGKWKVNFDRNIQPSLEHPVEPPAEFSGKGAEHFLEPWKKWGLGGFSGLLDYTRSFNIERVKGRLQLDLGRVCYFAEVWVNGKPAGARLWEPHLFDVTEIVRAGCNEVRIRVGNLVNNSYGDLRESGLFGPVKLVRIN